MPLWVSESLETVSSRTGKRRLDMLRRLAGLVQVTGPELGFVLEVISNLVFHTTNSFMSSFGRNWFVSGSEVEANRRSSFGKRRGRGRAWTCERTVPRL